MVTLTVADFLSDPHGRTYSDVVNDPRIVFDDWLKFFNTDARQQRMMDAEQDHERPALAGVVKELESHSAFSGFLSGRDAHTTTRGRQCIGTLVSIYMQRSKWQKTGIKGSLGTRAAASPGSTIPGAYHNKSGLSKWFTKAEHYVPETGFPY
jgi:hypothetical protein